MTSHAHLSPDLPPRRGRWRWMRVLALVPLLLLPFLLLPFLLLASPAAGQSDRERLQAAEENYIRLFEQGLIEEAIPHVEEALDLALRLHGEFDPMTGKLLNDLATLNGALDRFDRAETLFRRAIGVRRRVLGPLHPHVAITLSNRAEMLFRKGDVADAIVLLRVSLAIREQNVGPASPELIPYLNGLATMQEKAGGYDLALALRWRALDIAVNVLGETAALTATQMDSLANHLEGRGRVREAEALYGKALVIRLRPEHPADGRLASSLGNVGRMMIQRGASSEAEPLMRRALDIWEKALGPDHLLVALALNNLAALHGALGRHDTAETYFKRALDIRRAHLGPDHPDVAQSLNNLAYLYRQMGRPADAEPLYRESLRIRRAQYGNLHPEVAESLNNLGILYQAWGRPADAEPLFRESLMVHEALLGSDRPELAVIINNLAVVLGTLDHFDEADLLFRRARTLLETVQDPDGLSLITLYNNYAELLHRYHHLDQAQALLEKARDLHQAHPGDPAQLAQTLSNLAAVLAMNGEFARAEADFRQVLAIRTTLLGAVHPTVVSVHESLGELLQESQRWAEAKAEMEQVIQMWTVMDGADSRHLVEPHASLAWLSERRGDFAGAEHHLKRSLAIVQYHVGPENPYLVSGFDALAAFMERQGRLEDAARFRQRAVDLLEAADDPRSLATALYSLARLEETRGRSEAALALHERAFALRRNYLPADHWQRAESGIALAGLLAGTGQAARAETLLRQALELVRSGFGADHPRLALPLAMLAEILAQRNERAEADRLIGQASRLLERAPAVTGDNATSDMQARRVLRIHLRLALSDPRPARRAREVGFHIGQRIQALDQRILAERVDALAARGDDGLADLARQRHRMAWQWRLLDRKLLAQVHHPPDKRNAILEQRLRRRLEETRAQWMQNGTELRRRFPDHAGLAMPQPLDLNVVQGRLGPAELLLVYLMEETQGWLWAVRAGQETLIHLPIGRQDLAGRVRALRRALRSNPVQESAGLKTTADNGDAKAQAHALWRDLVAPAERQLDGVTHIRLVTDGPLDGLPFAALVMRTGTDGQGTEWLVDRHALSRLPGVAALHGVDRRPPPLPAGTMVIFADPVLGDPADGERARLAPLFAGGDLADPEAVRRLSPTAPLAGALGKLAAGTLHMGADMTETRIRAIQGGGQSILVIAGPCLIGGPFTHTAQAALALTPPERADPRDDGLLTAAELARVTGPLNWLVLGGCETVDADGRPGAPGLAMLGRAALHGGNRAVLLSHWPPTPEALAELLRRIRQAELTGDAAPPAEILRQALRHMRDPSGQPDGAPPRAWAPFFLLMP